MKLVFEFLVGFSSEAALNQLAYLTFYHPF